MATEGETLDPIDMDDKNWRGGHAKYVKERVRKEAKEQQQQHAAQAPQAAGGAGARDEARQKAANSGLAAAFGGISILTAILGTAILFFTTQVAYAAFGEAVMEPASSTAEAMKEAADQVRQGKVPDVAKHGGRLAGRGEGLDLLYDVELRIIGSAVIGASLIAYLLRRAALAGVPDREAYKRLNLALAAWAAASIAFSAAKYRLFRPQALLVWMLVLVNVLMMSGPLAAKQRPSRILYNTVDDLRNIRTKSGGLYALYAVFFFLEGVFLVAFPAGTLKAATTRDGGEVGQLLWQLVAASAHIIVPVAAFNLKSAADTHHLAALTGFMQNAVLGIVALVHVCVLTRAASSGLAGPLGPVLLTAWSSALIFTLYNVPTHIEGTE